MENNNQVARQDANQGTIQSDSQGTGQSNIQGTSQSDSQGTSQGAFIHWYFQIRMILLSLANEGKKSFIFYTPWNLDYAKYLCNGLDVIIANHQLLDTESENIKKRYIVSLIYNIPGNINVKFSFYRSPETHFDEIKIYEYLGDGLTILKKQGRLEYPATIADRKVYEEKSKSSDECPVCLETPSNSIIMNCCGWAVVCGECAPKLDKCIYCKKIGIKFVSLRLEDNNDVVTDFSSPEHVGKFKLVAKYGDCVWPMPSLRRIVSVEHHPADINHYDYDIIITSSPIFNIYNLRIQEIATYNIGRNLTIIYL